MLKPLMGVVAIIAMTLSVFRAYSQAITLDEADTYFWFVARSANHIWEPFPNNHVLNTLLIWVSIHLFGTSSLVLRVPALLGAAIYIAAAYCLSRSVTHRRSLQLPVFICLVYNPLILDFMAAARGYGLANGFLLAAIAIPIWQDRTGYFSFRGSCGLASMALGLSFCANFSFAFVNFAVFVFLLAWALRHKGSDSPIRILGLCVLPGLLVTLLICGYPLTHWPGQKDLWWGAHSWSEMGRSLIDASLYKVNSQFAWMTPLVLPVLGSLCALRLLAAVWERRWPALCVSGLGGTVALTLLFHGAAFRFRNLPLPISRTGIFLLPLVTLLAAGIAAWPVGSLVSRWLRTGLTASFYLLACYFLLCLRVHYFKEYEWDADVNEVYAVLARLNHSYGVKDVDANGTYVSPLNFCRIVSHHETFPEFKVPAIDVVPGHAVYVLQREHHQHFIESQHLAIIFQGSSTPVVIAVPPGSPVPPFPVAPAPLDPQSHHL